MRRLPWLIFGLVLLVALFVALGCGAPDMRELPQPRTLEETQTAVALTATITPTATSTQTPTPTNTPTPTRTNTPSPTMQASNYGVHVYEESVWIANGSDCATALAAGAAEVWARTLSGGWPFLETELHVCNMNAGPVTCSLGIAASASGWSAAIAGHNGCYGNANWCSAPANWRVGLDGSQDSSPCTFGGVPAGAQMSDAYTRTTTVYPASIALPYNVMELYAAAAATSLGGSCIGAANTSVLVDCGPTPTASPTVSPSPTSTATASITPTPSATPTASRTPIPGATPYATPTPQYPGCGYRYCAANSAGTPVASALVAVSQDRQATNVIRSAKTDADACRNFYLPGGLTYFFPQKSRNTFTNPDARDVPTPSSSSCGWEYCVVDAASTPQPIQNALIAVSTSKTGLDYVQTGRTDATGCVRFIDIPAGGYYIFRSAPTFVFAENPIEVTIP